MNVRHSMKRDEREGPTWLASALDHKVRIACDRCNNGWMHDLEEHVRSVATPMILGQRIALDLKAEVAVATWAVKTAMVAEFAKTDSRYFTQAERRDLMDALLPSKTMGAHVWVAQYGSTTREGSCANCAPGQIGAHLSTFAFGQLTVQVFIERRTAGYTGEFPGRPGPWKETLIEIWPPPLVSMVQGVALILASPFKALSHAEFEQLCSIDS
jgi:hypothetical protein